MSKKRVQVTDWQKIFAIDTLTKGLSPVKNVQKM